MKESVCAHTMRTTFSRTLYLITFLFPLYRNLFRFLGLIYVPRYSYNANDVIAYKDARPSMRNHYDRVGGRCTVVEKLGCYTYILSFERFS